MGQAQPKLVWLKLKLLTGFDTYKNRNKCENFGVNQWENLKKIRKTLKNWENFKKIGRMFLKKKW